MENPQSARAGTATPGSESPGAPAAPAGAAADTENNPNAAGLTAAVPIEVDAAPASETDPAPAAPAASGPAPIDPVPEPDAAVAAAEQAAARARARALDLPADGLGRLAEVSVWIAAAQGVSPPRPITRARALLLAADHGVATAGLYPWPAGATARRAAAVATGGSPLAVLARRADVGLRVVDVAIAEPAGAPAPAAAAPTDGYRVRGGNGRIDQEDALTVPELDLAFETGRRLADEEIDGGADLLVAGALGVGADTAAAVVVAALRDLEPIDVVDRGDGSDDERWMLRTAAIRDALRRARPFASDPRSVLRVAGGADLAALAGLLVQAASRRTPVIIDGAPGCAAALAAERIAPGARAWWLVGAESGDPAAKHVVGTLGLRPLVDLSTRADDGTGALAAAALVIDAVETAVDLDAAAATVRHADDELSIPDIT
ncbi:nicotinate-nucleotide--dimethylbenzimidazole phosphoribosyltransferase [Pseudofrankia inefficax]|uniref:nicotinate-nucleotide--dimethylbenzimidazole phosphoribosyltransferase n=1 Tax=Pseudofrankia inefficax (strain DSM 45817 / CECT 9037 / DDB 130130 / EuI1c) TaxID=298654 RepID=UPI0003149B7A|nr:nicotinate-nucleotide--dimethylbenzimidazole phosphoribosyltransferase [Pseudofrankia inefficax]